MADSKTVLSVGQCSFDHANISRAIQGRYQATIATAATREEAMAWLKDNRPALVLVNRLFDEDGDSGIDFLREAKASHPGTPFLLVSNLPEAQAEAQAAGAVAGFGKAELNTARMNAALDPWLV
jgi:two-component system chemotaxis response regulator CheY